MRTVYLLKEESDKIKGIATALYMRLLPILSKHKDEVITYPSLKDWEKELNEVVKIFNENHKKDELSFSVSAVVVASCSVQGKVEITYKGHKLLYFPELKVYGYNINIKSLYTRCI